MQLSYRSERENDSFDQFFNGSSSVGANPIFVSSQTNPVIMANRGVVPKSTLAFVIIAITLFSNSIAAFRGSTLLSVLSRSASTRKNFHSSFGLGRAQPRTVLAMTNYPIPRREEDRAVYAGVAPEGCDDPSVPRQSAESSEKLLDPPVAIADPYGWMRDMKRENVEVLDHLKAENEYTQGLIKHLEPLQEKLYNEFLTSIQEVSLCSKRTC